MKKFTFIVLIVFIPALLSAGKGERRAWRKLKKETNAICLFIPKPPIAIITACLNKSDNEKAADILKCTRNIKVLIKEDVSNDLYDKSLGEFRKSLKQFGYDPVLTIIKEEESIACYLYMEEEVIKKAYLLMNNGDDIVCIRLKGRFTDRQILYLANDLDVL